MQNILITGANRGIGLALTRRFLELGQRVFAGVRNPDNQTAFADLPGDVRARLGVVGLDVGSDSSVRDAQRRVSSEVAHLDVLVNMAGVSPFPHDARLDSVDLGKVREALASLAGKDNGIFYAYGVSKTALNLTSRPRNPQP